MQQRKILITSALPYANGPIHVGHLVEYIQTDIWARFQRLRGHLCHYVCADDAHGTPIMLRAATEGISPEQLIARFLEEHQRDFADFHIVFDNYYTTHSRENRLLCESIYHTLHKAGHIHRRNINQAFDTTRQMFLPDRYIRGGCPRCNAEDQYGDSCQSCGATYSPSELKNAVSVLSGTPPVEQESEHYFFDLPAFTEVLHKWLNSGRLQDEVTNKLREWFAVGLKEWDISRDAPYFGFRIPDTNEKFFYVWLDAPIGYLASFMDLCDREGLDFNEYFQPDSTAELYHFIGKDIIYFHGLFWPAILRAANYRMPTAIYAHGFLTVHEQKMSKSRGTLITARRYLEHLDPEYLRYYFACRLDAGIGDLDLNLEDFTLRVNADLVGKLVNIASRSAVFIERHFAGRLADQLHDEVLFAEFAGAADAIATAYEQREYAQATRRIMELADRANRYIDQHKPWQLAKRAADPDLQAIATMALNCYRQLVVYLKPVLPMLASRSEAFLGIAELQWEDAQQPLLGHSIGKFKPLLQRVDAARVQRILTPEEEVVEPAAATTISSKDFERLDLRVARVSQAEYVEGADRLLRLHLDTGTGERQVLAGIRSAYTPEQLQERLVILVANLAPRKTRFGVSAGMILAAGDGEGIFLLAPDTGAQPGMQVR